MKRYFAWMMLVLLLAVGSARAQGPDDQYFRIYSIIQEADSLNESTRVAQALAKYREAQTELERFKKGYPDWNPDVIKFRLNYLANKIATASAALAASAAPQGTNAPALAERPDPAALQNQIGVLQGQLRELQADKSLLEAKLKEALAAVPAAVDPRELTKAEDRIKALQKEVELLKVSLTQEKAKPVPVIDTNALAQAQQGLAEATRQLTEQKDLVGKLSLEREALLARLKASAADTNAVASLRTESQLLKQQLAEQKDLVAKLSVEKNALQTSLKTASSGGEAATALRTENESLKKQLAEQKDLAARLGLEKAALQANLKPATAGGEALPALRAENESLKKQLADLKAGTAATPGKADDTSRQLTDAKAQIASLQSDKELLRLEKIALEERMRKLPGGAAAVLETVPVAAKVQEPRVQELEAQMTLLRARVQVLEAKPIPYNAEELAFFKRPDSRPLAAITPKKTVRELPAPIAALVSEARRCMATRQYDKAEQKYLEALRQDEKNVVVLGQLAATELQLDHFDPAEKHLRQALAIEPADAFSLSVLGCLQLRQRKFDEALDSLSRSAALDPDNAETQNFLGLALSQKGLRGPAETAFRKAVQLQPNFADAHHNLAVAYLDEQPPMVELARYHYQKALNAGQPRSADLEKLLEAKKTASPAK